MAKILNNPFIGDSSGAIEKQLVVRQTAAGPVLAAYPKKSSAPASEAQRQSRARFAAALRHGEEHKGRAEYVEAGRQRQRAPAVLARSDYLKAPRILAIELDDYQGKPGDEIRVRATDNFRVASVAILIADADGSEVERGEMERDPNDQELWRYRASKEALCERVRVEVVAFDLPGNEGKQEAKRGL